MLHLSTAVKCFMPPKSITKSAEAAQSSGDVSSRSTVITGTGLSLLLVLAHSANDAFANILSVLLPTLQARFTLSETALASFVAVVSISSNVLQPVMGALSDRWGKRRLAALGLIVGSVLMSLLAVAPSVWVLVLLLAVGGLGSAAFHPAASSMVRAASRREGLSVGVFTAGGPFGSAVAPVVVLAVIANYGTGAVPYLAVPGVLIGLVLLLFAPPQERSPAHKRSKLFDLDLFMGPIGVLCAVGVLRSLAYVTFLNAMPLWLVAQGFARDSVMIGWTLGVYNAAAALGVVISGALDDKVSRRLLVVGSILLALPLMATTLFVPTGSALFFVNVALAGLMANAAIPLLVVSAQDLAPHAVATASGMLMGLTWGTAGVLYLGMGALQSALGLTPAILIGYAFLLPGAALAYVILGKHHAKVKG